MYKFPDLEPKCKTLAEITTSGGKVLKNADGTVMVYYNNIPDYNNFKSKSCCEKLGYTFDIDTQKCYWNNLPTVTPCSDCITKIVYNPKNSDGTLFNINDGEKCDLNISLDYILNFDCDLFTKTCTNTANYTLSTQYKLEVSTKEKQIKDKKLVISTLETKLFNDTELFKGLCYVIKGIRTVTTTNTNIFGGEVTTDVKPVGQWSSPWLGASNNPAPKVSAPIAPLIPPSSEASESSGPTNPPSIATPDAALTTIDSIPTVYLTEETNLNNLIANDNITFIGVNPNNADNILPLGPLYNPIKFKNPNNLGSTNTNDTVPNNTPPPPPFAWIWKVTPYFNEIRLPTNTVTSGPVTYCLTERGLVLWETVLGITNYSTYIADFGCDITLYTQTHFDNFLSSVKSELLKNSALSNIDFFIETKQGICDKKNVNTSIQTTTVQLTQAKADLAKLETELSTAKTNLASINTGISAIEAISNLESLKVQLILEVNTTGSTYTPIYEETIFNIGDKKLMSFILDQSPNTGILISGATAGGILAPASDSGNTQTFCDTGRAEFLKQLYLQQYKDIYPDPVSIADQLEFNKKMNNWYTSSWLYYNKTFDETITTQIKNKKIKLSLRIENCCLDLCILTDNLKLTKGCETLDNQEIIISESPKFEIEKVLDNKKSWVSYTENVNREHDLQFRETQYDIDDYRLTINTKEIDLKIDGANAIEEDVLYNVACLLSGSTGIPSCKTIDLDTFLTTELATINNVDEFRKAVISELIDVKNRQTLSSYPTLRLLYERYLGYCTDCNKTTNKFTYISIDVFIDLIGKHWVDLVEQFVPATTIWGATDVYRNMVFHQQKHTYRQSNLEFKRQITTANTIIGFEPLRTIENTYQSIIYDVSKEPMPDNLQASASTINFQAAAQINETPRSNPGEPIIINFQVGTTTQTFGNLTQAQLDLIQSQIKSNSASSSNNMFQTKKSINYGLSSGPGHSSPIFYGKITVK